jgi:uncharacterized protein (DUF4415 family)
MNDTPKPNPEALDDENPQLTPEELQRARPAKEFFGEERLRRMVGRPKAEKKRISTTVRFEADVLEAVKAEGKRWQTRINNAVKEKYLGRATERPDDPAEEARKGREGGWAERSAPKGKLVPARK